MMSYYFRHKAHRGDGGLIFYENYLTTYPFLAKMDTMIARNLGICGQAKLKTPEAA
jgi:hypothetical protein